MAFSIECGKPQWVLKIVHAQAIVKRFHSPPVPLTIKTNQARLETPWKHATPLDERGPFTRKKREGSNQWASKKLFTDHPLSR